MQLAVDTGRAEFLACRRLITQRTLAQPPIQRRLGQQMSSVGSLPVQHGLLGQRRHRVQGGQRGIELPNPVWAIPLRSRVAASTMALCAGAGRAVHVSTSGHRRVMKCSVAPTNRWIWACSVRR